MKIEDLPIGGFMIDGSEICEECGQMNCNNREDPSGTCKKFQCEVAWKIKELVNSTLKDKTIN